MLKFGFFVQYRLEVQAYRPEIHSESPMSTPFLREIDPEILHTCFTYPRRTVNDHLLFFFPHQIFVFSYLLGYLGLKTLHISG